MTPPDFEWTLGELPSAQHRAGLAGLVLYLKWLERQPGRTGLATLVEVGPHHAQVQIDAAGLRWVFDHLYAASTELVARPTLLKNRDKEVIPPAKEDEVEEKDDKGKIKKKKRYWYPVTVPGGGPQDGWDPSEKKLWLKLWRDMVWSIPRGIPAQRKPFDDRAEKLPTTDAAEAWDALTGHKPVELGSTLFFGAQSRSAERVPFQDHGRYEFLLHFQPYALQVYVPTETDRDGKSEFTGFALVIPDVADLEVFVEDFPEHLKRRDGDARGYRPAGAVIDLPMAAGLDLSAALRQRVRERTGSQEVADTLAACEVLFVAKEGNNIRLRGQWRVEPDPGRETTYLRLRKALWSAVFRRQRLGNLLRGAWVFDGFDRLIATQPLSLTIHDGAFCHDARLTFDELAKPQESDMAEKDLPDLVLQMVTQYVFRRVEQKTGLTWETAKGDEGRKRRYEEAKEAVARDAFLAVRGRVDQDFVEYFVGTLCSVPQHITNDSYLTVAAALSDATRRDQIRTLTLLALSARS